MRRKITIAFISIFCLSALFAQKSIDHLAKIPNSDFLKTYTDTTRKLTIQQVMQIGAFEQIASETPNFSYSDASHWFVFSYTQNKGNYFLQIENPLLDTLDIYFVKNKQVIKKVNTGDYRPFSSREYETTDFLVKLPQTENETISVYFKTYTQISHLVPVKIYNEPSLIKKVQNSFLVTGIYYGAALIMFFFNLFLFIGLKDKSYLYYILFLMTFALSLLTMDGFLYEYLFRNHPWWNSIQLYVYVYGSTFFGSLFAMYYLELKSNFIKAYYLIRVLAYSSLIMILITFVYPNLFFHDLISSVYSSIVSITGLIIAIILWKRGYKPARYFVTAYGLVLIAVVAFTLKELNVYNTNFFIDNVLYLGSSLEMMFLSLGLSNRYNLLKEENEKSQREIIKNLQEIQKIKSEATRKLEEKVVERTKELHQQKLLVEDKNKNITDSIKYAKRLQDAMMPSLESFKNCFPDSFILYQPKDIVAGDFYWMEELKDKILVAAADCTGHGVPGAMVSVVCSDALNKAVWEKGITQPAKILDDVKNSVVETFSKSEEDVKDGMDIALFSISKKPNEKGNYLLEFSGAHNPLWIIRQDENEIEVVLADIQEIGKSLYNKPFDQKEIEISKGDSLYVFSDGYADQFGGERGKKMKINGFKQALLTTSGEKMQDQHHKLTDFFNSWKRDLEQVDDVCVIGVRV